VSEPVSIHVDTYGTGVIDDHQLVDVVKNVFDLRPRTIIRELDLMRPIYRQTASYGHFGREGFSWEALDKVEDVKSAARISS